MSKNKQKIPTKSQEKIDELSSALRKNLRRRKEGKNTNKENTDE